MIVDFVEKKIEKYTDNKQFGFIRGRNCQLAINELKKEKEYNIIIAIDIFRAYEFIDKKITGKIKDLVIFNLSMHF